MAEPADNSVVTFEGPYNILTRAIIELEDEEKRIKSVIEGWQKKLKEIVDKKNANRNRARIFLHSYRENSVRAGKGGKFIPLPKARIKDKTDTEGWKVWCKWSDEIIANRTEKDS